MLVIKNEYLSVDIAVIGAEVRRVTSIDGKTDYMWGGNPAIWSGISPLLFPIIGRVVGDQLSHNNIKYALAKHGFARHSEFEVLEHTPHKIKLQLDNGKLKNKIYPFHLKFSVTYSLEAKQLITQYEVENLSEETAYFSVGGHPAFKCPFDDEHTLADYVLEFSSSERLMEYHLTSDGLFSGENSTRVLENKTIQLSEQIFNNDALVFSGYISKSVSLLEKDSGRKITLSLTNFPLLGFWAKPGKAGYVCIEPWCGRADDASFTGELKDKASIISLTPNKIWQNLYTIKFDY